MTAIKKIIAILCFPLLLFAQYTGGSGDGFFVWQSNADISLPVELIEFECAGVGDVIQLTWETASEFENIGYSVERSIVPSDTFNVVGAYKTHPSLRGQGSSSHGKKYKFIDKDIRPKISIRYRVFCHDFSGRKELIFQTSAIYIDDFGDHAVTATSFQLKQNYPNPFNPETTIPFVIGGSARIKIDIYSINGRLIETLVDKIYSTGQHSIRFNFPGNNASGVYICRLKAHGYEAFIKMTYLK